MSKNDAWVIEVITTKVLNDCYILSKICIELICFLTGLGFAIKAYLKDNAD